MNVAVNASGLDVLANRFIAASDARIKTDVRLITAEEGLRWIARVRPRLYRKNGGWESGFFAQDWQAAGFNENLILAEDPEMPERQNGASGPPGKRWEVIQGAPEAYLAAALGAALDMIKRLERRITGLEEMFS